LYGIIDKATGKVYAKNRKRYLLQPLIEQLEVAYPNRWFEITEVSDEAELVGDLQKEKGR